MNYLTRSFFYGLCPLVKLLLGFSWIEKGGSFFLNVALFMGAQYLEQNLGTESLNGKQRKDFCVVSYNDEPCLDMVISCTYLQCWSEKLLWMGAGGEIIICTACCLRDIKDMETVK